MEKKDYQSFDKGKYGTQQGLTGTAPLQSPKRRKQTHRKLKKSALFPKMTF